MDWPRKCVSCGFPYNASEKKPCENCGKEGWSISEEEKYYSDPDYILLLNNPRGWSEDFRRRQGWF